MDKKGAGKRGSSGKINSVLSSFKVPRVFFQEVAIPSFILYLKKR
jgi:hypothetical protein